jgi:hypothetical protein
MGRIRPMAAVPRAWRPVSGARSSLSGSRPTVEATRPASVRPAAEAARRLALAGTARTGGAVTVHTSRAVVWPVTARRWMGRGKVSGSSTLAQRRRRWARGKWAGLTLAAARREGAERRHRRRGGGRRRGREGSGEQRGGPVARGGGEGGGCGAASERDENTERGEEISTAGGGSGTLLKGRRGHTWRGGLAIAALRSPWPTRQRRVRAAAGDVEQGRARETGGGRVDGVWSGSGVWGPASGREGKVREVDRWGRLQCRWFR